MNKTKYIRAILMSIVGFGMIGEIFLELHIFHGIGIGLLLILACEEMANDSQ